MSPIDHTWIVQTIKDQLVERGVSLSGPCGAFEITKRVAWQLRFEGAGLLFKDFENRCEDRAVDVIVYPDGEHFDCLIDGGGRNEPAWQPKGQVNPDRRRAPVDPGDTEPPPPPPPPPEEPTDPDAADFLKFLAALAMIVEGLDNIAGAVDKIVEKVVQLQNDGLKVRT